MLVQALAQFTDTYLKEQLQDEAWENKPVPYFVAVDRSGSFLSVVAHNQAAIRGKKTVSVPASLRVPRSPVPRNAGLYPLLAADDIRYVLGCGAWTADSQRQNHQERHDAFVSLIRKAAGETQDEGLLAAASFYARPDQVDAARKALGDAKPGTLIALALSNGPLVNRPLVKTYWSNQYAAASRERVAKGGEAECLVSGKIAPIAPTHEKIKGLASLGGQPAGVSLMSFDKEAFRSYGWEQNANSPVSSERAMAYVLALNELLRPGGKHRRDVAGIGFIFWTKEKSDFDFFAILDQPQPEQVGRLLDFDPAANPEPDMFYMAGVSANGGRLLVRYWVAETLAFVKANVKSWFDELRVAGARQTPKLWQLLYALDREGQPPPDRSIALIRRAIEGPSKPLGLPILSAALSRLRVLPSNRSDPVRLGLIRACLNDNIRIRNKGELLITENLDPAQKHEAYLCGRLMALYESLQIKASGKVTVTVADRFFPLASTFPALAFPKLEDLGNKHLRKLRRDNPGAMIRLQQEIDRLHLEVEQASGFKFPKALDLDGQGRFALGYHHQRAYSFAQAQDHKKAKEENETAMQEQEII